MKKRFDILFSIFAVILLLGSMVMVLACGWEFSHKLVMHEAKEATCYATGNELYFECEKCHELFLDDKGEVSVDESKVIRERIDCIAGEKWFNNKKDLQHYHVCKICNRFLYDTEEDHIYGDEDVCLLCGYERQWEVNYRLDHENNTYIAASTIRHQMTIKDLIICDTYNDLPVTGICDMGFSMIDSLLNVRIGNNVINIGEDAFAWCINLQSVEIGKNVINIGEDAFAGCVSLKNIKLSNGLEEIGRHAFYDCNSLTDIVLPNSLKSIEEDAFISGGLEKVFYYGTSDEWEKINIKNSDLLLATRYYYSSFDPKLSDDYNPEFNYWHYDENEEIVIWEK